ncbi:MAG: type I methionyl aminopeptidase [Candidatus Roizmanbacteria bacterium]
MNIDLKTKEKIRIMQEGGFRLKQVAAALLKKIDVGITTRQIDNQASEFIKKQGGEPSFKKVNGYFWSTCLPVNDQVVHTPPSDRKLKHGDVLTLDIGMYFKGYHTDFATTVFIGGDPDDKINHFLETGKRALNKAIIAAKLGNRLGQISSAIEKEIYGQGFFILKELTGHGIGKTLHEDPYIFGYKEKPIDKTLLIKPGLTIAIEVIYSMRTEEIAYEKESNWSIRTKDGSLSACFEHTVAVIKDKTLILT